MLGALDLFKKRSNIIVGVPRDGSAEIARFHVERSDPLGTFTLCQRSTQMIVDDRFERPSRPTGFRLQARRHVIFERKSSSHIMMLPIKHHDV
jgi:hypothetical protein